MSVMTLFLLAAGVSMDAFAVSICKGLAMQKLNVKKAVLIGAWFGGFQALMPIVGYLLGSQFKDKITAIDHWIAFLLLGFLGVKMIREALTDKGEEETDDGDVSARTMFLLSVATSIDALAIGITLAFLQVQIIPAVTFIGVTTFLFSAAGVKLGNMFGTRFKAKAEVLGGGVLILLGTKILLEHLGILNF